jgi:hypothetical protein
LRGSGLTARRNTSTLAIYAVLPSQSGQDGDYPMFAESHIGILSIDDLATHVYFHFVDADRDTDNLRAIIDH